MTDKEYLDLFRISEKKYIIGIYQDGITVYKQQIRALNIFHTLITTGQIKLEDTTKISIIGGGVAGLTFAAAALKCNMQVRIFESEQNFLHMQHGCDTRKIHPNIYEWPEPGALYPNAKLPVLSWTYDTASNVCKQILKEFEKIKSEIHNSKHVNAPNLYDEYFNCKIEKIEETQTPRPANKEQFVVHHTDKKRRKLSFFCDLVIYAVGYGVEIDKYDSKTPSYWRNDALGQSMLNTKKKFLISGMGDGGLMDLFRLKIRDFNYDLLLEILKSNAKDYNRLAKKLGEVKVGALVTTEKDYYMNAFEHMSENFYKYIYKALEDRNLIRHNEVVLHSRRPFKEALDHKKISLLNAFLAYVLDVNRAYTRIEGDLFKIDDKFLLNKKLLKGIGHPIVRYGTDKAHVINRLKFSAAEKKRLAEIQELQEKKFNSPIVESRWKFGDINSYFDRSSTGPQTIITNKRRKEYLSPDTISICLSHVNILAKTLVSFAKKDTGFRIAYHRIIKLDSDFYYQQITPYCGMNSVIDNGRVQSVYPIEQGSIGFSIKSGKPILTINEDALNFGDVLKEMNISKTYTNKEDAKSFLTIPILGAYKPSGISGIGTTNYATNLVLFLESTDKDFFRKQELIDLIIHSTKGFIDYISHLIDAKHIYMSEMQFEPSPIEHKCLDHVMKNCCVGDIKKYVAYDKFESVLKFKDFHSFDIVYNK